ncbi:pathogenesis-related protein 1-like [Juglans microcarpa x Juglans regia]|uniref:pathogenesis-related protein 1-like n=1 Tax=Juglans microcarpa x Juglans regia TaxID=2249226 RepID=UPI001B7F519F|nr:pathogenesis-related protein 1-like [Juglans microcarpa x Juglans regia]
MGNISLAIVCVLDYTIIHLSCPQIGSSPQDYVNAHNAARSEVGIGPITWNATIAAYAQNYANQRKGDCRLVHSGGPYGENLAWSSGDLSGTAAVNLWVAEKADYNATTRSCAAGRQCGHYTQVVWRYPYLRLGCGKVRCNDGGTFITCNYDPPGNYVGEQPF